LFDPIISRNEALVSEPTLTKQLVLRLSNEFVSPEISIIEEK